VLPEQPHSTCLWPLLTHFFGKGDARTYGEAGKAPIEHTILVEINLAAVGTFEEAEFSGWIDPHDLSNRLRFMLLHLPLHSARVILQAPTRPHESIIESESNVGIPLIRLRRSRDIDLPPIRERETNIDLVEAAGAVMAAGSSQHDPAGGHATIALFEVGDTPGNIIPDFRLSGHPLKIDFDWRLHAVAPDDWPKNDYRRSAPALLTCVNFS
jgi:hypothetical protein